MAKQAGAPKEHTMQLAEILSDLVSLRVCDPAAALALVSTRSSSSQDPTNNTKASGTDSRNEKEEEVEEDDVDLKRAKDLLKLHYEVKEAHKRGGLRRGWKRRDGG
ncbi:hypothetical protein N0V83_004183 [Neocucurbitaria cava]|uniref:Uncharacterized protein n=1 Tax=Neocucurbitaria cava TaxID=798079 RepID=A0A9W8YBD8_9PLEO|nr:hypothetical protein N0V83_004183 [Neocucurbitaria cava]